MEPARYTGVLESYVNGETDIVLDPAIDKKPHGFWRDWCNFESELKKIIKIVKNIAKKYNAFPPPKNLFINGRMMIRMIIQKITDSAINIRVVPKNIFLEAPL